MLHGYDVSMFISSSSAPVETECWLWFLLVEVSVYSTQACLDSVGGTRGNQLTLPQTSLVSRWAQGRDLGGRLSEERRRGGWERTGSRSLVPSPISSARSLVSLYPRAGLTKASGSRFIQTPWRASRPRH